MGFISFFQDLFGITARRQRAEDLQRSRERSDETRHLLQAEARRVAQARKSESIITSPMVPVPSKISTVKPSSRSNKRSDADVIHSAASDMSPDYSDPIRHQQIYHAPVIDHSSSHHSSWSSHDSGSSDSGGGDGGGGGGD